MVTSGAAHARWRQHPRPETRPAGTPAVCTRQLSACPIWPRSSLALLALGAFTPQHLHKRALTSCRPHGWRCMLEVRHSWRWHPRGSLCATTSALHQTPTLGYEPRSLLLVAGQGGAVASHRRPLGRRQDEHAARGRGAVDRRAWHGAILLTLSCMKSRLVTGLWAAGRNMVRHASFKTQQLLSCHVVKPVWLRDYGPLDAAWFAGLGAIF